MDIAAEYNNRAMVPDHAKIIARWHADAAAYREKHPGELDIVYGARPRNRFDYFPGRGGGGQGALIVYIHGGYWRSFDKPVFSHVAGPANAAGFDVAVPGYTLCPEVTVSDIIDDLRQCCLFLGQRYGRRLVVTGHSAGGHLAAAMAATDWQLYGARPDLIQACLSISGIFDLRPLMATPFNDDLRLTAVEAATASPLLWPMPNRMPFESWVGAEESFEFRRQARSLAAAWQGLGLPCRYEECPGENHFSIGDMPSRADAPMTERLLALARA
ncbi:alpha/beta hydrolase [Aestuariivirga sp.]|uniref:alpha/beta hydrolase n=1 Tax=Aestuariivirga sp. TaxID=2650926 RepID=UPI003BA93DF9